MKIRDLILAGIFVSVLGVAASCDSNSTKGNYMAVKTDSDGLWGLVAPDGSMLFENEFKQPISDASEGLFIVPEENLKSIYMAKTTPVPLGGFSGMVDVGMPSEGKVVLIDSEGKIVTITSDGNMLFTLPADIILTQSSFKDGLLGVCNDKGLWGFVNDKGETVIPCKYMAATMFSDSHAIVAEIKNDKTVLQIIDKKGAETARVKSSVRLIKSSQEFHKGRIPAVNVDNQFGFLTIDGTFEKCSHKVTGITNVTNDGFIFQKGDGKYGAMDYNGEILVQPRYDELSFIPGSKNYLAKINNSYSELNDQGEKIIDFTDYKTMMTGTPGFPLVASTGTRYELLNTNGKVISKTDFAVVSTTTAFNTGLMHPVNNQLMDLFREIDNYLKQVFQNFNVEGPDFMQNQKSQESILDLDNYMQSNVANIDNEEYSQEIARENPNGSFASPHDFITSLASGLPSNGSLNYFKWLSEYKLTPDDVATLSKKDCRLLRNAILPYMDIYLKVMT